MILTALGINLIVFLAGELIGRRRAATLHRSLDTTDLIVHSLTRNLQETTDNVEAIVRDIDEEHGVMVRSLKPHLRFIQEGKWQRGNLIKRIESLEAENAAR